MLQYGQASPLLSGSTTRANRLDVSLGLSDNPLTRPLVDGSIVPEGLAIIPTLAPAPELFWRQLRFGEFDISEMSVSSLLIAAAHGDRRWAAIPVFPMRSFFHTWIVIRKDRGITTPADLRGKRIGVPEYQQTAAIWSRGVLEHEFAVHPRDIEWFMERNPAQSHGGGTGFTPPHGVRLSYIPSHTNIGEMLVSGELDGSLLYLVNRDLVDRSRIDISKVDTIGLLFENAAAEARRYFQKTGIFPLNHTIVVRRDLLEAKPWIALNLYNAFAAAQQRLAEQASAYLKPFADVGQLEMAALERNPMPYGLKANRLVLETIARYVHEQGLTDRLVPLDDIFAASTMDL